MTKLLIKPQGTKGRLVHVTPENAGWDYVGFDVHRLDGGETVAGFESSREVCLVFITGKGEVAAGGHNFGTLGERMSPFEGKPAAFYVPAGMDWSVSAVTDVELAVCSAPDETGTLPPRIIATDNLSQEVRGSGTNTRHIINILPESQPASSLLVVEVITPGGHSSSYPPHKHDQNNPPHESLLEETYYHRLNPPQGFAFQRVYTDDRSLDEAMAVENGDVTLVPKGYHPCAACHGYDLYYLNVMAGPIRSWKFHNAPEHEWLIQK